MHSVINIQSLVECQQKMTKLFVLWKITKNSETGNSNEVLNQSTKPRKWSQVSVFQIKDISVLIVEL